ncbi:MAG: ABC transporter ATP-binding protein [Candidatus Hodarchaeales archaeon]|jgi:ABC-type branched-subunit amino acid transport system ATPase component
MSKVLGTHLEAKDIYKNFGGVRALKGAGVVVNKNQVISLIGPNGCGKTTLFNVITCWLSKSHPDDALEDVKKKNMGKLFSDYLHKLKQSFLRKTGEIEKGSLSRDVGSVSFEGERIDSLTAHEAALTGMMRTFQTTRNWPKLTALENLLVAPHRQTGESFLNIFLKKGKIKEEERQNTLKALEILEFLEITHIRDQLGEELSGGQLKLLALGRLLMTAPRLILLDEPMAGVNPTLGNKIMDKIVELKDESTIFLIEHNMDVVFNYSDEIFVMASGKIIARGTPKDIETNREVVEAYLGKDY